MSCLSVLEISELYSDLLLLVFAFSVSTALCLQGYTAFTLARCAFAAIRYGCAGRTEARVIWQGRRARQAARGGNGLYKYRVEFYAYGKRRRGIAHAEERGLESGDVLKVRYVLGRDGSVSIIRPPRWGRLALLTPLTAIMTAMPVLIVLIA